MARRAQRRGNRQMVGQQDSDEVHAAATDDRGLEKGAGDLEEGAHQQEADAEGAPKREGGAQRADLAGDEDQAAEGEGARSNEQKQCRLCGNVDAGRKGFEMCTPYGMKRWFCGRSCAGKLRRIYRQTGLMGQKLLQEALRRSKEKELQKQDKIVLNADGTCVLCNQEHAECTVKPFSRGFKAFCKKCERRIRAVHNHTGSTGLDLLESAGVDTSKYAHMGIHPVCNAMQNHPAREMNDDQAAEELTQLHKRAYEGVSDDNSGRKMDRNVQRVVISGLGKRGFDEMEAKDEGADDEQKTKSGMMEELLLAWQAMEERDVLVSAGRLDQDTSRRKLKEFEERMQNLSKILKTRYLSAKDIPLPEKQPDGCLTDLEQTVFATKDDTAEEIWRKILRVRSAYRLVLRCEGLLAREDHDGIMMRVGNTVEHLDSLERSFRMVIKHKL